MLPDHELLPHTLLEDAFLQELEFFFLQRKQEASQLRMDLDFHPALQGYHLPECALLGVHGLGELQHFDEILVEAYFHGVVASIVHVVDYVILFEVHENLVDLIRADAEFFCNSVDVWLAVNEFRTSFLIMV